MTNHGPFRTAVLLVYAALLGAPPAGAQSPIVPKGDSAAAIVELRGGEWFTGSRFERGSRWMQGGRFVPRPKTATDRVVSLDGQWLVPPYADAHTHSPDGVRGFDAIRDMYLGAGVFYVQVLGNHRSGRIALGTQVNVPTSIDAVFADAPITGSGGHPQVLYESLALFRTPQTTGARRQQAARSLSQDGDVYRRLDSASQLPPLIAQLRAAPVPLLKVMVLHGDQYEQLAHDTTAVGNRGIDPKLLQPLVDSAHAMGRRVWVHIETARDFEIALDAGVDGFAHVPGYGAAWAADSELAPFRLSDAVIRRAGSKHIPVVATLGLSWATMASDTAANRRSRDVLYRNVRRLADAGARMITGSDTYSSLEVIENDVTALSDALGLSPLQRLQMRAVDTPRAVFPGRAIGALRVSYEASLLALSCNPLVDATCQQKIVRRLKQGTWLSPFPPPADPPQQR